MATGSTARLYFAAIGFAALGACARPTRDIEPAPVDPSMFMGMSCSRLVAERTRRSQALIFRGSAQDQLSEDDKMRTLGVPTPVGTLFGEDRELEIARLKGELHAVLAQMVAQNCGPDYR